MSDIQEILGRERGMKSKVARALEITPGAVSQWKQVSAEHAVVIERECGIPRHVLRPDLWEAPAETQAEAAQ